jgi:hypothetical protein
MMRGVLSFLVVCVLGGVASANPGDPMPAEQPAVSGADSPKAADSKFEVKPEAKADKPVKAKHKSKHKARKRKKSHRKTKKAPAK